VSTKLQILQKNAYAVLGTVDVLKSILLLPFTNAEGASQFVFLGVGRLRPNMFGVCIFISKRFPRFSIWCCQEFEVA
jgi:hypothetical protein